MCRCVNIEVGSYANQYTMRDLPDHMIAYLKNGSGSTDSICIDECLAGEIRALWYLGITTTGCCCGHNKFEAFIGVIKEDIPKMKMFGYEVQRNECRPGDEDSFYSKLVPRLWY